MGNLLSRNRVSASRSEAVQARERHYRARRALESFAVDSHRPALTFIDGVGVIDRWTFEDIAHAASRWGALLRSRGLRPGDRLLVRVGNTPAWPAVHIGALQVGLVPIPCPAALDADAIRFWVESSRARIVVTDRPRAELAPDRELPVDLVVVGEVRAELGGFPEDGPRHDLAPEAATFMFVSGATDAPDHEVYADSGTPTARPEPRAWLDTHRGDLAWCSPATRWEESIWNVLLGPWSRGAEIVLHDAGFDPEQRYELLQRLGVTVLCQTADEYRSMATHPAIARFDLARLRQAVSVGGPLDPGVARTFQDVFGLAIDDRFVPAVSMPTVPDAPEPLRGAERLPAEAQPEQAARPKRRDEAEARRLATAVASEERRRRKQEGQRLRAEAKAAADEARREDEERRAEEQRAEQERRARAREEEQHRKEEADRKSVV